MQNPAYQQLAKEFMDLWQKQISAAISDKQFIQSMLGMFQSVKNPANEHTRPSTSAHASAAPDADHGVLAELAFRLAMCEKRLSALEQRDKKPAAKRSARAGKSARSGTGGRSKKPHK